MASHIVRSQFTDLMAAFVVSVAKLGDVEPLTLRAFHAGEVDQIPGQGA